MEDYHLPRPSVRSCWVTHREFSPGESFYVVLLEEKKQYVLHDYSQEAWTGVPPAAIGYWQTRMPEKSDQTQKKIAVNDILMAAFDHLAADPGQRDKLYILSLLMIRRRLFRLDEEGDQGLATEALKVYCPRRDETYTISVVMPDARRQAEIQQELACLLAGQTNFDGEISQMPKEEEAWNADDIELPEITEIDAG